MFVYDQREFKGYNHGIEFRIVLKFEEEDQPISDTCDFSDNELKGIYQRIDNGEYVYFCAHMEAWYNDVYLSDDCLGSCLYESFDEFINEEGYFQDMVNNVLRDGYDALKQLHDQLMGLDFMDRVDEFKPSNENMIRGIE